jgi:hypothetical protein
MAEEEEEVLPDEAENARMALRALWDMSGQMESADKLGQEQRGGYTGGSRKHVGENFKALEDGGSGELGFEAFSEGTNEPTFDREEAVNKMRSAFKGQLSLDGKLVEGGKSLGDAAAEHSQSEKPT